MNVFWDITIIGAGLLYDMHLNAYVESFELFRIMAKVPAIILLYLIRGNISTFPESD